MSPPERLDGDLGSGAGTQLVPDSLDAFLGDEEPFPDAALVMQTTTSMATSENS
jgi:hypothetical protein